MIINVTDQNAKTLRVTINTKKGMKRWKEEAKFSLFVLLIH